MRSRSTGEFRSESDESNVVDEVFKCRQALQNKRREEKRAFWLGAFPAIEELSEREFDRLVAAETLRIEQAYCRRAATCTNMIAEPDLQEHEWLVWTYEECLIDRLNE